MSWLKRLFCSHPALKSEEINTYGLAVDTRIVFSSPWSLFGTKETHYLCNRCGAKYWYPKGNQYEKEMCEKTMNLLLGNKE